MIIFESGAFQVFFSNCNFQLHGAIEGDRFLQSVQFFRKVPGSLSLGRCNSRAEEESSALHTQNVFIENATDTQASCGSTRSPACVGVGYVLLMKEFWRLKIENLLYQSWDRIFPNAKVWCLVGSDDSICDFAGLQSADTRQFAKKCAA